MNMSTFVVQNQQPEAVANVTSLRTTVTAMIDNMIDALPDPQQLTSEERRGIIARYSSVLEGNFIYWMTAALIAVKSDEARDELVENLHEEVKDAHPDMLRRFAIAAHAFPTDQDALAVDENLTKMRKFLGRLSPVQSLAAMAFFEGFIQRFMPFLADLAAKEGSKEMVYTDVHGVCDIEHTEGLYRAVTAEAAASPTEPGVDLLEGANLLRTLIEQIVNCRPTVAA
jgi:uncharacterized protein YdiU (UPF0061 family)